MARLFPKKRRPAGLPPGSLLFTEQAQNTPYHLSIIEYNEDHLIEKKPANIDECLEHLTTPSMTWIEVNGVSDPAMIAAIGKHFQFHPLVLEDIISPPGRVTRLISCCDS